MPTADSYGPVATAQKSLTQQAEPKDTGAAVRRSIERITMAAQAANSNIGVLVLPPNADIRRLILRSAANLSAHTITLKQATESATTNLGSKAGPNNSRVELDLDTAAEQVQSELWISSDTNLPGSGTLYVEIEFVTGQD